MVWRRTIVTLAAGLLGFSAQAAGEWEQLAPGDAKVTVDLDWTAPESGYHVHRWSANYGNRMWVSGWTKRTLPRLEVSVIQAGPGHYYRDHPKVDKGRLKSWNFLAKRNLTLGTRSSAAGFKTVRFDAGDTSCIHFARSGKGSYGSDTGAVSGIRGYVSGYYCAEKAATLSDQEISTVLGAIRFRK